MIILAACCILAILFIRRIYPSFYLGYRIWSTLKQIPGPKPHWLLGNINDIGSQAEFLPNLIKLAKRYPKMYPLWYGPLDVVLMVNDPATIRKFVKAKNTKELIGQRFMVEWTGPGVLYANGQQWARSRRLLTPAFHFDVLKRYMAVYNECGDILLNKWSKHAEDGKPFEILDDMSLMTFDIILQCACSVNIDPQRSGSRHKFLIASRENTDLAEKRFFQPLHQNKITYQFTECGKKFYANVEYSRQFSREVILKRKKALENGQDNLDGKKRLDFLDVMLTAKDENGVGMTVDEMVNEVITFLFAGHDTTSSAMSWIMYSMAKNPECQEKCQQEIDEVVGDRTILWEDLSSLKYTTLCIKETLRMHTIVPLFGLTLGEDLTIDGITFPKGMDVEMPCYFYHHDQNWWKDPWVYNPMRFAPDSDEGRDPYSYMPFSVGSRNCIGQNFALHELKCITAKILQRYKVLSFDDKPFVHVASIVLKNEGGIWLGLKERK